MTTRGIDPPGYFEPIRQAAVRRWDQLDSDPELSGPWHQLFKQVQNPRHVLSELLQNADDAGAGEASARIEDGVFVFEHDGEDFSEEHFRSLCRFGYSNKRSLHTIGFRGIGFKSTFSLGDTVEVHTPTLSVCFDRRRFTEPQWLGTGGRLGGKTCIRVVIKDQERRRQLEKNFEEWRQSPLSLLFFRNLRRMQVGGADVCWRSTGPGPVPASEWYALGDGHDRPFLLVRSPAEPFPDEALDEIRQERMLASDEDSYFPPSTIELVLGPEERGGLFVVLPSGVETRLPFSCNAPLIQDPARLKIKDPSTSPTNRWLLERAGRLAATSMLAWLRQSRATHAVRAAAYGLLPDVDPEDSSLEGACGSIAQESFAKAVEGGLLVFTDTGGLVQAGQGIALPHEVLEVWSTQQAQVLFDERDRPALSRHISAVNRQKLLNWTWIEEITRTHVVTRLTMFYAPRPKTWRQLLTLWTYVAPEVIRDHWSTIAQTLCIVPVDGKDNLYSAGEAIRLGNMKAIESQDDRDFLAQHLSVVDQTWLDFLEKQQPAKELANLVETEAVKYALLVLVRTGLSQVTPFSKVIDRVAAGLLVTGDVKVATWVHLTHLAAHLKATASASFRYVTRDGQLRPSADQDFFDADGRVEELIPQTRHGSQLLHPGYADAFRACSRDEWRKWAESRGSGLQSLPRLRETNVPVYGTERIRDEVRRRGSRSEILSFYAGENFQIDDWDFEEDYWTHWHGIAKGNDHFWGELVERIVAQGDKFWNKASKASALQVSIRGGTANVTTDTLPPAWLRRLRELPCLRNTRGSFDKPADLLRRTTATEPVFGIEPFVHNSLDVEANRAILDLLGVQSTPTGPARLLECLRSLAMSEAPPASEVDKWYCRLDAMLATCPPGDAGTIKDAFRSEKLIYTAGNEWMTAASVFRSSGEEDVPGTAIVRPTVADLALWQNVGVAERSSVDLVITWLKTLPSGSKLSRGDLKRVESLVARHPVRIWEECGHWINLADEWVSASTLDYALARQSLAWSHLHDWAKQRTADLRHLLPEAARTAPFAQIPALALLLEDRLHDARDIQGQPEERLWLTTFGSELLRFVGKDDDETKRVRDLALRVATTRWQHVPDLAIIPYLNGTPAGMPRNVDVVWLESVLYVTALPMSRLAKRVPEEIARPFPSTEIRAALSFCFGRASEDVREYLEENFTLVPAADGSTLDGPVPVRSPNVQEGNDPTAGSHSVVDRDLVHTPDHLGGDDEGTWPSDGLIDGSGYQADLDLGPDVAIRRRPRPGPSLIERFAASHGFRREDDSGFFHADGGSILKSHGESFHWERRTASGVIARYYWPFDQCLDLKPIVVPMDVWFLLDSKPDQYSLILADENGDPIERSGAELRELKDRQMLSVYPATYRLVLQRGS